MWTVSTTSTLYSPPTIATSTPYSPPTISTSWDYGMVVSSILIAIFGTAANTVSLSYFINRIRSRIRTRNNESSTTKLFAVLNTLDLIVSVTSAFEFILFYYPYEVVEEVFRTVCMIAVILTGFLTCLLAVVRVIHLAMPFHVIDWRTVNASIVVFSVVVVVLRLLYLLKFVSSVSNYTLFVIVERIEFLKLAGVFLIVVVVNVISLIKLHYSQSSHKETKDVKRKATVTVAIISTIYCLCNVGSLVIYGAGAWDYFSIPFQVTEISYYILLPLNSACNPVVYLIRKEDMRKYVRSLGSNLANCECKKRLDAEDSVGSARPSMEKGSLSVTRTTIVSRGSEIVVEIK